MLFRICFVCVIGMLEYVLVLSREAKLEVGVKRVCCSSRISSVVFLTLTVCGSEAICFTFDVKSLDNVYAGALCQFTIGRMD
jgi:hypothetical protein